MKVSILFIVLFSACVSSSKTALHYPVDTPNHTISVKAVDLGKDLHGKLEIAINLINSEVFYGPTCTQLKFVHDDITTPQVFVYDTDVDFSTYNCFLPWAAISSDRTYGKINLCGKRINPADWPHALDPDVYLMVHNLSKILGLTKTRTRHFGEYFAVASYTSNDSEVMKGQDFSSTRNKSLLFRFSDGEKAALRARYCY